MVTTPEEEEERPAPAEPTRPESPAQPLSPPYSAAEDQELDEDQQELQRLREELAALHQQFESPGRRQRQITVLRQVVAAVLVFVAALGVTMSVVGVWAGNTILNTDRWVETVSPLSQGPAVRAAVATYSTEQIFTTLNVERRVKEALPPRAAFLASPLAGAVHGYVQDA